MNRTALCIKMLILLRSRGIMTSSQIADILETNQRNIREFKKELIVAGYNIKEKKGRYGGYYIDEECLFPSLNLNDNEINALKESKGIVESHPEFANGQAFLSGLDKVLCANSNTNYQSRYYLNLPTLSLNKEEYKMLMTVQHAIDNDLCVQLTYQTLSDFQESTFIIDPYDIIHYKNAYYVIGFSHKRNDYRIYRFSIQRMHKCVLMTKKFLRDKHYNIRQFIGTRSLIKGDFIQFVIQVDTEYIRMIKEQYWGLDFKEIKGEDDKTVFSFMAEDTYKVYQNLFLFKDHVKIISPEKNRKEYIAMIKDVLHLYQE